MNNLEKAKSVIKEYYEAGDCGIFDSRNIAGDSMTTVYEDDDLCIDICYGYSYFEVFGLSDNEFEGLAKFYEMLGEQEAKP